MAGIVFYFEDNDIDVFSGRIIDLSAWNYAAKIGDVDKLLIVNRTNQSLASPNKELDFTVCDTLPELENAVTIVCPWENENAICLWDYSHSADWYIFGPASGWRGKFPTESLLTIPQNGMGAAHSLHVASCVMYHRYYALGEA